MRRAHTRHSQRTLVSARHRASLRGPAHGPTGRESDEVGLELNSYILVGAASATLPLGRRRVRVVTRTHRAVRVTPAAALVRGVGLK